MGPKKKKAKKDKSNDGGVVKNENSGDNPDLLKKRRAIGTEIEKLEKQIVEEKRAESTFFPLTQKRTQLEQRSKPLSFNAFTLLFRGMSTLC